MTTRRVIYAIDQLSKTIGHAFAWCIVILAIGTTYEVIVRYAFNAPTDWAFDFSYILYGGLFFMSGAYTLSRGGHVRADMFSRTWPPRVQAGIEILLYVIFFFPGILAMVIAGSHYAHDSFRILEKSINSPIGVPIWQIKLMIPFGAGLIAIQGVAEVLRAVICLREGVWPQRLHDVEELEQQLMKDKKIQKAIMEQGSLP
jgi:TRAP-type mannitol/chloroaromatic compound transport system permease small subunit